MRCEAAERAGRVGVLVKDRVGTWVRFEGRRRRRLHCWRRLYGWWRAILGVEVAVVEIQTGKPMAVSI